MNPNYDDKILQHYNEVAKSCGTAPTSTMADEIVRRKETEAILHFVRAAVARARSDGKTDRLTIVDVGCGNGYTLSRLSEGFPDHLHIGVEFNGALRALATEQVKDRARIIPGDVRDPATIGVSAGSVDVLVCQRVLINLMDKDDQRKALDNIVSLVRPGGSLIFIECFDSGLQNLNDARAEFGLPPIGPAIHNLYLDDDFFSHPELKTFDVNAFNIAPSMLSTHYYVSRVLHEVVSQAAGVREQRRNSHFVKVLSAALPPAVGDYSPLRVYAWSKATR